MMGMALVTKYVIGNLSKKTKVRLYNLLVHCKKRFNSCILLKGQNTSVILKGRCGICIASIKAVVIKK